MISPESRQTQPSFQVPCLYAVFLDGGVMISCLQRAEQYPQVVNRARMFFLAW